MAKLNFKTDVVPFLIPGVTVLGGAYIVYKLTGGTGGQTPADVNTKGLVINEANLKQPAAAYESAAENSYRIMNQDVLPDNDALLDLVKGMNGDELRAVYKAFGKRSGMISLPLVSAIKIGSEKDIFAWYTLTMHNNILQGKNLDAMKVIWKPSNLWK